MKKIKNTGITIIAMVLLLLATGLTSCNNNNESLDLTLSIPTKGNSWAIDNREVSEQIFKNGGIKNLTEEGVVIRTYFKTTKPGRLNVGILANSNSGAAKIKVSCNGKSKTLHIEKGINDTIFVGNFDLASVGYNSIDIEGIEKSGEFFPEISAVLIGGEAAAGKVYFAKEDFYWGRRGPSVHLSYQIPENAGDILYYYNEITVPEGNDVLGSYFMSNGFGQGYFGMQVNSPTERHILFSVWSPYKTNNPADIPADQRIKMLKKGEGVHTGKFGNEGSGGQSYYNYMWKAGNTYKFLLKGEPTGDGKTDFTAWFFAPEVNNWKLIASFRRPKTDTYLTRFHSFLENFIPGIGNLTRRGNYANQWVYTAKGEWIELTKARFTADATARKESRMDYSGGAEGDKFFMKNCGFFNETTPINSHFERETTGAAPAINFDALP